MMKTQTYNSLFNYHYEKKLLKEQL